MRRLRPSIQTALEFIVMVNLGLLGSVAYIHDIFWGIVQLSVMALIMVGATIILEKYGDYGDEE